MTLPHIWFAPVLRAEGWLSIDLQQQNIIDALSSHYPELSLTQLRVQETGQERGMRRRWLRDVHYPRFIRANSGPNAAPAGAADSSILHISDHSYGHLCSSHTPCVINCNDLHHFVEPRLDPVRLWMWRRRVSTMKRADRVLTISAHLAEEVREHLKMPEDRVTPLPGGIDTAVFHPIALEDAAQRMPHVAELRQNHLLITNIGTNYWRKNLPTVLRAVKHLREVQKLPVKLLKVGPALRGGDHEALIQELGVADAVVDLGRLAPEQVAAVCAQAHALSFASMYEGFGRPTLEAQACGLPCVLADSSCMKEIGGDAALYHEPLDHEQLAAHLEVAMSEGPARDNLISAGYANVQRYSWQGYAEKLVRVYREVAA